MAALLSQAIPRLEHVFDYLKERFKRSGRRAEDVPMPNPNPAFVPSLQIVGNLFAVMRSSGRAYDPNDYSDFEHGSLALPSRPHVWQFAFSAMTVSGAVRWNRVISAKSVAVVDSVDS